MIEFVVSRPSLRFLVRQPVGSEHEVDVVPGLRYDMVQSFDVMVSGVGSADLYTVVVATAPRLSLHDRAVIARALASTRRPELVFLVDAAPGSVRAESSSNREAGATAVAVAVVCASAGWDESRPLQVFIDEKPFPVTLHWDARNWLCGVP